MIRFNVILAALFLASILAACGGRAVSKSLVLQNAEAYTIDGMQAYSDADWKRAQILFTQSLLLYQGIDNQYGVLHSHINLAEVALSIRDYPTANKHLDRADHIVKQDSFHQYQRRIQLLYSQKALQQDQMAQAERFLQPLLPEFDQAIPATTPDAIQMAAIANRTKLAFALKVNEPLWIQRYANSLNKLGIASPNLEARLLRFQSILLQRQGQYQQSESMLQQALSKYKRSLSRSGIAVTLLELGQLNMTQARWQEAQDYLYRSITIYLQLKDIEKVIHVIKNQIKVELELGDLERSKFLKQRLAELKRK